MTGKLFKAANGHLSYEIFEAIPNIMFEIGNILVSKFDCSPLTPPVIGLDQIFTKCHQGTTELILGWDNWSGFYIMATSSEGDDLVKEIGAYLDALITSGAFADYFDASL